MVYLEVDIEPPTLPAPPQPPLPPAPPAVANISQAHAVTDAVRARLWRSLDEHRGDRVALEERLHTLELAVSDLRRPRAHTEAMGG